MLTEIVTACNTKGMFHKLGRAVGRIISTKYVKPLPLIEQMLLEAG